ncbi:hypothetical protein [Burkholderia cepacia]|uniref:hypothetical protein n=1 Tax=Burkholderia cepacia TaxID=292 RepID=UPI0012D88814|nr:hypothetical protein [Burkholderia cepacia]
MFDIDEYRKRKRPSHTDQGSSQMSPRKPAVFDGQKTLYRGNLYVHIDDDGQVDFDIIRAERGDAPALVMACLIMCMRLTKLIDEGVPS